jgi:hypothetical protein
MNTPAHCAPPLSHSESPQDAKQNVAGTSERLWLEAKEREKKLDGVRASARAAAEAKFKREYPFVPVLPTRAAAPLSPPPRTTS